MCRCTREFEIKMMVFQSLVRSCIIFYYLVIQHMRLPVSKKHNETWLERATLFIFCASCRCGADGELDRFDEDGPGAKCDYPCVGDKSSICGGYLAMTAYDIGELAHSVCSKICAK